MSRVPRPPSRHRRAAALAGALLFVGAATGCADGPGFDRAAAVRDVRALDPRLSAEQAECYVDRVAAELGPGSLSTASSVPPEQITKLTSIRVDCIGVANLGTDPPTTIPPTSVPGDSVPGETRPDRPGDDPALDIEYRACAAGDGPACDRLFDEAPLGSEYERFGSTCGDRTRELRCADVYPSATTAVASTVTTTSRPTPGTP